MKAHRMTRRTWRCVLACLVATFFFLVFATAGDQSAHASVSPDGVLNDRQTSIIYDSGTGELAVDAPTRTDLTSINIDSASGIFTGNPCQNLGGSFDNCSDNNIFKATFGGGFTSLSFGNVAESRLDENFVLNDLTVVGSLAGGGALGNVDLIYRFRGGIASFLKSADLDVLDIDFGILRLGSPKLVSLVLYNVDNTALSLDSLLLSGDMHILTTDLHLFAGERLLPGGAKQFTAAMKADTRGTFTSSIALTLSNELGREQTLTLNLMGEIPPALQAGDVNQDFTFDQIDLVGVLLNNEYLTGRPATWAEGDWDGAPGGSPGSPPSGDGFFNQVDIVAALAPGHYLTGPYATVNSNGQRGDGQTSVVYNTATGELAVDAPAGTELTSINIDSAAGIFTGNAAQNLGGSFDNDADDNIFKATFGSSFASLSFGNVAQTGLSEDFLLSDLTIVGSLQGGGDLGDVDLIYVPEPSSVILLAFGIIAVAGYRVLSNKGT